MSRLRRLFAMLALALVIGPLAAAAPLFDPDEGLHAAIAQEMVERGDYVTPTFMGAPFLDKPILFFWAEAASLRIFGYNEAAVRIPPLLFGLLGMLTVAMLGRALFGEAAGLIAGMAYGTMLLPMGVSEVAVHDIGLVPCLCIAALCLHRAAGRAPVAWSGIVAGVALGLSILTKGLVGVVFAGIFASCLAASRPSALARLAVVLSIAVVVAAIVAAPWYIAMERAHPGYLHYYFVERHLQGYLTSTQRHGGRPFWYYLPIVIGGALPWTGYLAGAARAAWGAAASPRTVHENALLVPWGWFAIGLVFLSIGESKLVTYALPLFPALAIVIGEYVDRVSGGVRLPPSRQDPLFRVAFMAHVATLAVLPAIGLVLLKVKFDDTRPLLWVVVIVLGFAIVATARRAVHPSRNGLSDGIVRMSVLAAIGLMIVTPRAAVWMTGRDLAMTLNAGGRLPSRVSVLDERIGSVIFYLDPALRAEANMDRINEASFSEALGWIRVDPPDAVLAVRNGQLPRFNRLFAVPPVPEARAGTFTIYRAGTLRAALKGA